MPKKKSIVLCSSASFYRELFDIRKELISKGFKVKVPLTANKMKRRGDFKVENYKTWFKDKSDYTIKSKLIRDHFQKILKGDSVLVLNYEKRGMPGYIGGTVLMEMA